MTDEAKEKLVPLFYSVEEAASVLMISRQTIYALMRSGKLPSALLGRRRLILRDDVVAYSKTVPTTEFSPHEENMPCHEATRKGGAS